MHSYHLSFSTLRPPLAFTDCKLLTDGAVVASDPCVVSCIAVVIGSPVITPTVVVVVGGLVVVGSGVSGISVWQVGRPTSPTSKPELTKNKLFFDKKQDNCDVNCLRVETTEIIHCIANAQLGM